MDIRPEGRHFQIGVHPWKRRVDHSILVSLVWAMSLRWNVGPRDIKRQIEEALPEPVALHLADQSAAGVRARLHKDGWCDGPRAPARGTTGQPSRKRSQPRCHSWTLTALQPLPQRPFYT